MNMFFVVIAASIGFLILACTAFVWSVRSRQFDDVERSGQDIFYDPNLTTKPVSKTQRSAPHD